MRKLLFFPLAFLIAGVAAAGQSVSYRFDKDSDFSKYKTYRWVNIPNAQQLDELTAGQLVGTVDVELRKKGLSLVQAGPADLYVAYQMARGSPKQLSNFNVGLSGGSAEPRSAGTAGLSATTVHTGELILDLYDGATKKLVWRGFVSGAIEAEAKPDKKQKHLDRAIQKLLKDYPPKKKG